MTEQDSTGSSKPAASSCRFMHATLAALHDNLVVARLRRSRRARPSSRPCRRFRTAAR
jgi:hypothetical protein